MLDLFLHITINLLRQEKTVLNTFLTQQLKKNPQIANLNRSAFRYYLKKTLKLLEKEKAVKIERISPHLFALQLINLQQALDLITKAPARNSRQNAQIAEQSQQKPSSDELLHSCILPSPRLRASQLWRELNPICLKPSLSSSDKEDVTSAFELWLNDVRNRFLLFKDHNDELQIIQAQTRFTSKSKAIQQLKTLETAFNTAFQNNWNGVFLTLTLPPIFPLKVQQWLLSFLLHRIKAYIRKKQKQTTPHVRVNEPHSDFRLHVHVVLFNTSFVMKKHALTEYLNKHLVNFLNSLGEHYKRTINKRASDEQVIALNKYGKKLLRKYKAYKRKNPCFAGPVNYLTALKQQDNAYTFTNPPPDIGKVKKTATDGGSVQILDYVKFYVMKNVSQACEINSEDENKPIKLKATELAFYWFARLPFFTLSPTLRPEKPLKVPAGWQYLGSCTAEELPLVLEQRFNLIQ